MTRSRVTQCSEVGENRPCVTIGMPLYNCAHLLEEALEGIVAQTFVDFKVVISDDASTDDTWEIVQRWAARDGRIIAHRQNPNLGHTENFRFVLDQADTEYFMWHAQDDWLSPNYLEELFRVMRSEKRCAFVTPRVVIIWADGTDETVDVPSISSGTRFGRTRSLLVDNWGMRFYGLFRTEPLRHAKAITEEFGRVLGWDAIIQLPFILQDQMRVTNDAVLYYRPNKSTMRTYKPQQTVALLRHWMRFLRFNLKVWRTSEISAFDKLRCLPWVLFYSIDSLMLRPVKAIVQMIRRPLKRFYKAIVPVRIRTLINPDSIRTSRVLKKRKQKWLGEKTIRPYVLKTPLHIGQSRQNNPEVEQTFSLATDALLAGRLGKAERLYLQVLQQQPRNAAVLHNLGLLYLDRARVDAVELLRRAVEIHPEHPGLLTGLGLALNEQGQRLDAEDLFLQALRHRPDYNTAYKCLVHCIGNQVRSAAVETIEQPSSKTSVLESMKEPRISIIVCSIDRTKQDRLTKNLEAVLGPTDYEMIVINDARSLCEGYNRGIASSTGDVLIFCHDDIEIVCNDFKQKLLHYLDVYDVIGVAGTDSLLDDSFWTTAGWPNVHGQVIHKNPYGAHYEVPVFGFDPIVRSKIQALDGLFFAANRFVVEAINFDEERFTGFHFYDIDFSFSAFLAGFNIAVCSDILLLHHSGTRRLDDKWRHYAAIFQSKYADRLASKSVTNAENTFATVRFTRRDQAVLFCQKIIRAGNRLAAERSGAVEGSPITVKGALPVTRDSEYERRENLSAS